MNIFIANGLMAGGIGLYVLCSPLVETAYSQLYSKNNNHQEISLISKIARVAAIVFIGICAGALTGLPGGFLLHIWVGKAAFLPVIMNIAIGILHSGFYSAQVLSSEKRKPLRFLALLTGAREVVP